MEKVFNFTKNDAKNSQRKVGEMKLNASGSKANLYFYGDIVSNTWQSYWYEEDKCPQDVYNFLKDLNDYSDLDIYINSGGGSVHGGLAIYNQLIRYGGNKTVHIDGLAASIAGVIAMAGNQVIVPRTGQFMMHKPWSSMWGGNADDYRREAEALDSCEQAIINVYMTKAKVSEEEIRSMIQTETWLTGEAMEQYFDISVEENGQMMNCISDYFNCYTNLPDTFKQQNEGLQNKEIEKMKMKLQLLCI